MHRLLPEDQLLIQLHHRLMQVLKSLNMPEIEFRMVSQLLLSPRSISRSSLAVAMGENRTTILPYVREGELMGYLDVSEHGVKLSTKERPLMLALVTQIYAVSRGERVGFDPNVVTKLVELQKRSSKRWKKLPDPTFLSSVRYFPKLGAPVKI